MSNVGFDSELDGAGFATKASHFCDHPWLSHFDNRSAKLHLIYSNVFWVLKLLILPSLIGTNKDILFALEQ